MEIPRYSLLKRAVEIVNGREDKYLTKEKVEAAIQKDGITDDERFELMEMLYSNIPSD